MARPARRPSLVLFLRAPRLGQAKRRLGRGIGAAAALAFYRQSAGRIVRLLARERRWRCVLAVTPDGAVLPREWRRLPRLEQGQGDLGRRMARAFAALPSGPAAIVGSDLPELTRAHIAAAFAALGRADAAVGPAQDGGYWLIGLARRAPLPRGAFARVRWSSADALADTLAGLPRRWRVARLETLCDIDDEADYRAWLSRRRGAP